MKMENTISNLREAVTLYRTVMLVSDIYLDQAGIVRPIYEKMDAKYFEREYEAFEAGNEFQMPVRKQAETLWISDRPFAIVLKEEVKNALGMDDYAFHYLVYRKKPIIKWSETINVPKYRSKPGIYLPFAVLKHMQRNMVLRNSFLVAVFADGRIYRAKTGDIADYFIKTIREKMFINEYGVLTTGISMDLFQEVK